MVQAINVTKAISEMASLLKAKQRKKENPVFTRMAIVILLSFFLFGMIVWRFLLPEAPVGSFTATVESSTSEEPLAELTVVNLMSAPTASGGTQMPPTSNAESESGELYLSMLDVNQYSPRYAMNPAEDISLGDIFSSQRPYSANPGSSVDDGRSGSGVVVQRGGSASFLSANAPASASASSQQRDKSADNAVLLRENTPSADTPHRGNDLDQPVVYTRTIGQWASESQDAAEPVLGEPERLAMILPGPLSTVGPAQSDDQGGRASASGSGGQIGYGLSPVIGGGFSPAFGTSSPREPAATPSGNTGQAPSNSTEPAANGPNLTNAVEDDSLPADDYPSEEASYAALDEAEMGVGSAGQGGDSGDNGSGSSSGEAGTSTPDAVAGSGGDAAGENPDASAGQEDEAGGQSPNASDEGSEDFVNLGEELVAENDYYSPGHSPGKDEFDEFLLSEALQDKGVDSLVIEIKGYAPGVDFDLITATGAAIFDSGSVYFAFIDGFIPKPGDLFEFVMAQSISILPEVQWYYGFFDDSDHAPAPTAGNTGSSAAPNTYAQLDANRFSVQQGVASDATFNQSLFLRVIPEPGIILLVGFGMLAIGFSRRKRMDRG
jgi:hypothetical protein